MGESTDRLQARRTEKTLATARAQQSSDSGRCDVEADPVPPVSVVDSWIDPLAEEAYYGLPGDIVRTIDPHTEADPAALLVQTLVLFGNLIGRTAHFLIEGDDHFGNQFAVLVGSTSAGRKGTSSGRIRAIMRDADPEWTKNCVTSGLSSAEGLIHAVRDRSMKREPVKRGRNEPPEYIEVEADPGVTDKRLMLNESEWASVLKQAERTGNTLSPTLRDFWDGKEIVRTLTKNSPVKVTGGHVSVVGHITPEELRRYMSTTEVANGFGNRHLFALTRRSKLLPRGGAVPRHHLERLQAEIREARNFAVQADTIGMTSDAWLLWDELYPQLVADHPGLAGALVARAAPHVRRLAMLYALLDRIAEVDVMHLQAATAVWDYCSRSVFHLFGNSTGDADADEIEGLLRRAGPDGKSLTELHAYFGNNKKAARIGQALAILEKYGRVRAVEVSTGGRSQTRWVYTGDRNGTKKTN